jgi:hypothetical protein
VQQARQFATATRGGQGQRGLTQHIFLKGEGYLVAGRQKFCLQFCGSSNRLLKARPAPCQLWNDFCPQKSPVKPWILIAGIRDKFQSLTLHPSADLRTRNVQERAGQATDAQAAPSRHTRHTSGTGSSQQALQYRLHLVIGMMGKQ